MFTFDFSRKIVKIPGEDARRSESSLKWAVVLTIDTTGLPPEPRWSRGGHDDHTWVAVGAEVKQLFR
jgi:hypothetical protein